MNIFIRSLGYILVISAFFRIIPIIAGIIYGEPIIAFVISFLLSLVLGVILLWIEKRRNKAAKPFIKSLETLNLPHAFMLVSLTFIILPLIGSISFLSSFDYNVLNAFFESISGFTTTGLTLYNSLEELPRSLLLWRAETQWIGGIGIVMVFLFIISRLQFGRKEESTQIETTTSLYYSQGFSQKLEPSLKESCKNVMMIYGGYTILGIFFLFISGKNLFESISLSFASISTGGFIVTDTLQATNFQLIILSGLMLIGSISFIAHNKLLKRKFKDFIFNVEKNIFFLFILISIGVTLLIYSNVKVVIFQLISAFTTTGFSLTNISALPHLFILMTMTGMLIGGSVASTSGGMKVNRVYSLLAMIPWMIKKLTSPRHAIIPLRINKQVVEEEDLLIVTIFVSLFLSILFIGTIIFLLMGYNLLDSSFQVASALGTVGLQTMELSTIPAVGKIILILAMLLGRLELFPLLILIRSLVKKFTQKF